MDIELIRQLSQMNTDFYQKTAPSFSSTRHGSWPGWKVFVGVIQNDPFLSCRKNTIHMVDLACGNLRFEAFLESSLPHFSFEFTAVDNCSSFPEMPLESPAEFRNVNLIESLVESSLAKQLQTEEDQMPDAVVSFGFFHHIPSNELRVRFINSMIDSVKPGGYICASFWTFLQEESLAHKAQNTTEQAIKECKISGLEPGDCILGWQNEPNTFRYCHSFCEREIENLIAAASGKAKLIDRFSADGRTGKLNTYIIMQKNR